SRLPKPSRLPSPKTTAHRRSDDLRPAAASSRPEPIPRKERRDARPNSIGGEGAASRGWWSATAPGPGCLDAAGAGADGPVGERVRANGGDAVAPAGLLA